MSAPVLTLQSYDITQPGALDLTALSGGVLEDMDIYRGEDWKIWNANTQPGVDRKRGGGDQITIVPGAISGIAPVFGGGGQGGIAPTTFVRADQHSVHEFGARTVATNTSQGNWSGQGADFAAQQYLDVTINLLFQELRSIIFFYRVWGGTYTATAFFGNGSQPAFTPLVMNTSTQGQEYQYKNANFMATGRAVENTTMTVRFMRTARDTFVTGNGFGVGASAIVIKSAVGRPHGSMFAQRLRSMNKGYAL